MAASWASLVTAAWLLLIAGGVAGQAPAGPPPARVSNPAELLAALNDAKVSAISVVKPMTLPSGWGPARVSRQLFISSPFRAMIDWCDAGCEAGNITAPLLVLEPGGMVTFNRLFFRDFIPKARATFNNPALDYVHSPVPAIVSRGGQYTLNLVVLHWQPDMIWVFDEPASFWAQARAADAIMAIPDNDGGNHPLWLSQPELYTIKKFSVDGSATINDCYMPFDIRGCLDDAPFNTTLVYCPYTFKDSLKNPWVDNVVVFHNIGLDRLVNSYRDPVVVNRTITYASCPGTRHVMELDNITNSVLVAAGGSLTFRNMILQGSKSQNKTDWPSDLPLLLSTFKPVDSGTITLRDSTVRVRNMDSLISALSDLPDGSNAAVEIPNLQPSYSGPRPTVGTDRFVIRLWQLQLGRWLLSRAGGNTLMDRMRSSSLATWQFFNVTVEPYTPRDCFAAAATQGALTPNSYVTVTTGQQLLDQLANVSARYIRVGGDLTLPPDMAPQQVTVNRIVEVRACNADGNHRIDWSNNHGGVSILGNAIFEGHLEMRGLGWDLHGESSARSEQVVDALHPIGTGIVEYEDAVLVADMAPALLGADNGQAHVAAVLGLGAASLDSMPLNMSLLSDSQLLLRGYYLNRSAATGGQDGLESFLDVTLTWRPAPAGETKSGPPLAAIVAPVVVACLLLLGLGSWLVLCCLRRRRAAASGGAAAGAAGKCGKGELPRVHANASSGPGGPNANGAILRYGSDPSSMRSSAIGVGVEGDGSNRGNSTLSSRVRSGPSADIAQACQSLVLHKTNGDQPDELVLQSVLGEGSYGKVFKATWRGTVVAVKIMILPSYMSGKERREKMAVMETAISSSLSHPNIVQTYTFSVDPVKTAAADRSQTQGPGAGISMHDSTFSWAAEGRDAATKKEASEGAKSAASAGAAFSWEVRLVQEWCDLGSLRDALKQKRFRSPADDSPVLPSMIDTALDVARAMAHLHKQNILHADLKARNVLLRSDAQDVRGFSAKVADFGLSLTISPESTHISNAFQGTLTHMAPETLVHGQVSRSSDVYAFGILLWELYTGEAAYKGVPRALLGHKITKDGLRPVFPDGTPFDWSFLACRCWESDPGIRPSFDQLMEELKRMKAKWAAAPGSDGSASPTSGAGSNGLLLHQTSAGSAGLASAIANAGVQRVPSGMPHGRLPSIHDSETLPTDVDAELQQQAYQQTLQQQLLRQSASIGVARTLSGGVVRTVSGSPGGAFAGRQQQQQQQSPVRAVAPSAANGAAEERGWWQQQPTRPASRPSDGAGGGSTVDGLLGEHPSGLVLLSNDDTV